MLHDTLQCAKPSGSHIDINKLLLESQAVDCLNAVGGLYSEVYSYVYFLNSCTGEEMDVLYYSRP